MGIKAVVIAISYAYCRACLKYLFSIFFISFWRIVRCILVFCGGVFMNKKPYAVIEWNDVESDAKGWLCAYNFVNHYCGGGTRMHPTH